MKIKDASNESDKCSFCGGDIDITHIQEHVNQLNVELNDAEVLRFKIANRLVQLDDEYNQHIVTGKHEKNKIGRAHV